MYALNYGLGYRLEHMLGYVFNYNGMHKILEYLFEAPCLTIFIYISNHFFMFPY